MRSDGLTPIRPCMGGLCRLRGKCLHHQAPTTRRAPSERLCSPGKEREEHFKEAPPERREG